MNAKLLKKIPPEQFARLRVVAAKHFAQRRILGDEIGSGHLVFDLNAPGIGVFHLAWKVAENGTIDLVGAEYGSADRCASCAEGGSP